MPRFEGTDFFRIEDRLDNEQRLVRDTVREFVTDKVLDIIEDHQRQGTFPTHLVAPMGEMGLYGANLEGYGCAGLDEVAYGLIMQELERGDSGLRSFVSVQGALCMYPIWAFGSEDQKRRWLPKMATGEVIGCFGLTEPDAGSDPGSMRTRAEERDDGWILNGVKYWITNGTLAHLAIVWARTDDGIRGFIVPTDADGFTANEIKGKYSLRASDTAELVMEDCSIPKDHVLPESTSLRNALMCLNQARYGIAWGAVGAAMACYEEAVRYSMSRVTFGEPIASKQMIQEMLAEMLTQITLAQLMCLRLGELKDAGEVRAQQISMAKRNNVRMALEIARECREILGGNGILDEYQAFRHMVNLESVYTYEGTHQIHTLVLGQEITGIAAF